MKGFARCAGFTLAEVMVSIAVVLILSAMAIGYSSSNRDQAILLRDEAAVTDYLMRARELALKGYEPGSTDVCAYGIKLDPSIPQIELVGYTDCSGDLGSAPSETRETYTLSNRVTMTISGSVTDIAFIPPEIVTKVNDGASLPASITLALGSNSITITISASGQITT